MRSTLCTCAQNNYGDRRLHPSAAAALRRLFAEPNAELLALLGPRTDLDWARPAAAAADERV